MAERPDLNQDIEHYRRVAGEPGRRYISFTVERALALMDRIAALEQDNARLAAELAGAREVEIPARGLIHIALHIVNNNLLGQADQERLALEDAATRLHSALARLGDGAL